MCTDIFGDFVYIICESMKSNFKKIDILQYEVYM